MNNLLFHFVDVNVHGAATRTTGASSGCEILSLTCPESPEQVSEISQSFTA